MSATSDQPAPISVLVVDDEVGYRDLFSHILKPMGVAVYCAADGPAGLELFGRGILMWFSSIFTCRRFRDMRLCAGFWS
jgi:CheY-like chemotaxis protein